jgi:hypothetical protein
LADVAIILYHLFDRKTLFKSIAPLQRSNCVKADFVAIRFPTQTHAFLLLSGLRDREPPG